MPYEEAFLRREIRRTNPDFILYAPAADDSHADHGNEHLHVFRAKDGNLCALWTMSVFEGTFSQRPVFSRSLNGGLSWSSPKCLLRDPIDPATGKNMGSWAAAATSKSGRIYVIYNKHQGTAPSHQRGKMTVLCSDDCGETWSSEATLEMPRSPFDPADPAEPADWVVWQNAYRLSSGTVLMGFTRGWLCSGLPPAPNGVWVEHPCSCEFFRLDNIDADPAPEELQLTFLADPANPLTAPLRFHRECFCAEEPALCELPDGRLFCVMRTAEGHVWYSISDDEAVSWRSAEMLLDRDGGEGIRHPLSPSPMFRTDRGEYFLLTHEHDGYNGTTKPQVEGNWRNPLYIRRGEFRPGAHQPVWFSAPVEFMNNGGVRLNRMDLAIYGDMTLEDGEPVLWYPDRKFFLLGRHIPRNFLSGLSVPPL